MTWRNDLPPRLPVTSDDLRRVCADAVATLGALTDRDWSAPAADLEWSCRDTIDHLADALMFYAVQLATRSPIREPRVRLGFATAGPTELIGAVESAAAILARLADEAGSGVRAFHTAGQADTEGFLAMGCDEILVHTHDVVSGLGGAFAGDDDLTARVVARLFPWAPAGFEPWPTLLWCNGRIGLDGHPRLGPDWFWECSPLDEWDGTVRVRKM